VLALIEFALHAAYQFSGERSLNLASAERTGHTGAALSVVRPGSTNAQFGSFVSALLAAAILKLPAIHLTASFWINDCGVFFRYISNMPQCVGGCALDGPTKPKSVIFPRTF